MGVPQNHGFHYSNGPMAQMIWGYPYFSKPQSYVYIYIQYPPGNFLYKIEVPGYPYNPLCYPSIKCEALFGVFGMLQGQPRSPFYRGTFWGNFWGLFLTLAPILQRLMLGLCQHEQLARPAAPHGSKMFKKIKHVGKIWQVKRETN